MLEVFVVCTAVFFGLVCGWWLRGADRRGQRFRGPSLEAARTREVISRLRELTQNVASDVDRHKAMMGRINDELQAFDAQQPTAVLRAVDKLIQFNERMQHQLNSAEKKLEVQARQIVNRSVEALTDALTGLANRRAFDRDLSLAYRGFIDRDEPAVVMMIDIDHFKNLNDTYGHQAGDQVLHGIAQVLREHIPKDQLVARYGGEEFAVIFSNACIDDVEEIAEQARRAMGKATYDFDGLEIRVTASAGIAHFVRGDTASSLIGRADEALYASKELGRDCAHFHDVSAVVLLDRRQQVERQALVETAVAASYDVGISSPEVFSMDLRRRMADSRIGGTPLCVLFVQIDDLESIRDRHGEENCDAMVRALTLTLKATMREIDHAARFEGQTLSLLLPGATLRGAVGVSEQLRIAASQCELPDSYPQRQFTISIGVGQAEEAEDAEQLISRVRDSLAVALVHGRDCTYVHDGRDFHLIGVGDVSTAQ